MITEINVILRGLDFSGESDEPIVAESCSSKFKRELRQEYRYKRPLQRVLKNFTETFMTQFEMAHESMKPKWVDLIFYMDKHFDKIGYYGCYKDENEIEFATHFIYRCKSDRSKYISLTTLQINT